MQSIDRTAALLHVIGKHDAMHLATDTRPPVQRDRLIKLAEVERLTSLKKSTLYRLMREGKFVRCVQVTPRCTAWPESQVLHWVQQRITSSVAQEAVTP